MEVLTQTPLVVWLALLLEEDRITSEMRCGCKNRVDIERLFAARVYWNERKFMRAKSFQRS